MRVNFTSSWIAFTCSREAARRHRSRPAQPLDDVPSEGGVVADPGTRSVPRGPVGRAGQVQGQVAHRADVRVELEQAAVLLQGLLDLSGVVGRAEAAPGDEIGAGRDRRGRVDLEQGQSPDDLKQVARPRGVEQLRAHGDAPRLRPGQSVRSCHLTRPLLS